MLGSEGGRFDIRVGQWYRAGSSESVESPEEQSRRAMHALRDELKHRFPRGHDPIRSCPIGFAVAFPDWDRPGDLRQATPMIYDSRILNTPGEFAYRLAIDVQGLDNPVVSRRDTIPPTAETLERLVNYLAPNMFTIVTVASQLGTIEYKLNILTNEQHSILDMARKNNCCLIEGVAGTGKTMLALEYAHRAAKSGQRVGLLCFNVLLGNYLKEQTEKVFGITAGAFWPHIIRSLILNDSDSGQFLDAEKNVANEHELYESVYPFYAELALSHMGAQFDVLVVDEAPDLCRTPYLELMDMLLADGLRGGSWAMFGDFSHQAIFPIDGASDPKSNLLRYFEYPALLDLTVNCRTTSAIALDTARIAGFDIPETRPIDGPRPEYRYWQDDAQLSDLLDEEIRRLVGEQVDIDDIVVLSERRLENSGLAIDRNYGGYPLATYSRTYGGYRLETYSSGRRITVESKDGTKRLKFFSIPNFKGMESQVVILILHRLEEDSASLDRYFDGPNARAYAYIGMSRARGALVVLAHAGLRDELKSRLAR